MSVKKVATLPKCNFCDEGAYCDAHTLLGPWAYMCKKHFAERGQPGSDEVLGTIFVLHEMKNQPYDAALEAEWLKGVDIEEIMLDDVLDTACPDGCRVEPDGKCSHGYSSPCLLFGVI